MQLYTVGQELSCLRFPKNFAQRFNVPKQMLDPLGTSWYADTNYPTLLIFNPRPLHVRNPCKSRVRKRGLKCVSACFRLSAISQILCEYVTDLYYLTPRPRWSRREGELGLRPRLLICIMIRRKTSNNIIAESVPSRGSWVRIGLGS